MKEIVKKYNIIHNAQTGKWTTSVTMTCDGRARSKVISQSSNTETQARNAPYTPKGVQVMEGMERQLLAHLPTNAKTGAKKKSLYEAALPNTPSKEQVVRQQVARGNPNIERMYRGGAPVHQTPAKNIGQRTSRTDGVVSIQQEHTYVDANENGQKQSRAASPRAVTQVGPRNAPPVAVEGSSPQPSTREILNDPSSRAHV